MQTGDKSTVEVIINAEPLETRVAVLVESRLDDFTVERTNTERLVGSVYKGKVKNLEDGGDAHALCFISNLSAWPGRCAVGSGRDCRQWAGLSCC
jgi:hypothetical protein